MQGKARQGKQGRVEARIEGRMDGRKEGKREGTWSLSIVSIAIVGLEPIYLPLVSFFPPDRGERTEMEKASECVCHFDDLFFVFANLVSAMGSRFFFDFLSG